MSAINPRIFYLSLSLLSGVLMYLSWPPLDLAPLAFVGFIPLIILSDIYLDKKGLFKYVYLAFLVWNIISTWWIWFASPFGAIAAIVFNALFMALVFQLYHYTRKKIRKDWAYFSLPVFWIGFEFLHLNWDLSWPWLTLGNVFATAPELVQWYEFTGVLGGSLWILLLNLMIYRSWQLKQRKNRIISLLIFILPMALSISMYYAHKEKGDAYNVTVVQPNIDPYNEKFSGLSARAQMEKLVSIAEPLVNDETDYLVAPETAIPTTIWDGQIAQSEYVKQVEVFLDKYPDLEIITGMSFARYYDTKEKPTSTARKFRGDVPGYYDAFNTALHIDRDREYEVHHKSRLVPGVEKMPYPILFSFLETFAIDLGGTSGSLAKQDFPSVFKGTNKVGAGPIICYESVYGEYVRQYVQSGADLLMIITNDGWWSETDGHRQHLHYARLRCIETRRSIARSANTGISCFINQRGDISQATEWWVEAAINETIYANDELTVYSRIGDLIGRLCLIIALLLSGVLLFNRIRK